VFRNTAVAPLSAPLQTPLVEASGIVIANRGNFTIQNLRVDNQGKFVRVYVCVRVSVCVCVSVCVRECVCA
jgi:hypothetical protein